MFKLNSSEHRLRRALQPLVRDGFAIDDADYRIIESAVLASNSEEIAIHVTAYVMFDKHRAKDNEALFTAMSKSSNRKVAEIGRIRLGTR